MPNRAGPGATRTPSVQSFTSLHSNSRSMSMTSPQVQRVSRSYDSDQYSDTASEDDHATFRRGLDERSPSMWLSQQRQSGNPGGLVNQKQVSEGDHIVEPLRYEHREVTVPRPIDDDATSRSSTLDGNEEDVQFPEKTMKSLLVVRRDSTSNEPVSPAPAPHVPGPLESQLAALMSKLIYLEHANPAVSIQPEEYQATQDRLKSLEEEKKHWWKRHEAIWALRDEDVENNIKIRVGPNHERTKF